MRCVKQIGVPLYHQKKPKNPIEMEFTTLQKINNLIKDLPDYLAEELLEYIGIPGI